MPKFFYTFIILFLVSAVVLSRTIFWTSPQERFSLFIFFFSFFLAAVSFFSVLLSLLFLPKSQDITNQRLAFRKIFRVALTVSLFLTATGILKVISALNPLTFFLLLLLAVVYSLFIYK